METNHLREYVYLAETLSFKRTSEHFFISRSVISRHLSALEESLQTKLVIRNNHNVQLTKAGEVFYRDAQIILRDLETALQHIKAIQSTKTCIVRIGYLRNAARPVLVQFVKYMQEHYPTIEVSLVCMEYSDLRRALDESTVDIALAVNVNPDISRNYRSTRVYHDQFFVVMSHDHPLAANIEGVTIDQLPEDKLLLPDSFVYAGLKELIDNVLEPKLQLRAREYYRDFDMLNLKVQTEGFIAFSSGRNASMFGKDLVILPLSGVDSSFTVSAFYRNGFVNEGYFACKKAFEALSRRARTLAETS